MNRLYCIVGLGNPGVQYSQTRHNAGFLTVDRLLEKMGVTSLKNDFRSLYAKTQWNGNPLVLVKPQTYMNLSGEAVRPLLDYFKIPLERVIVVYDEMDLPLGALRFRLEGSAGGHRGLASIIQHLGTDRVARLRIGIGRPPEGMEVSDYVLSGFSGVDKKVFEESILKAAEACIAFVDKGADYTMNHYNISPKKSGLSRE
ncbi:MAG TPA: aminoacyl-tRNA hydrolase [Bacillota bacterium]|nr:aminoacyl-tRNA hydrolase [Bacillota bacterium]HPT86318.1 aminoacyl-tRNA hydrolase [Bacillota bacterium]